MKSPVFTTNVMTKKAARALMIELGLNYSELERDIPNGQLLSFYRNGFMYTGYVTSFIEAQ